MLTPAALDSTNVGGVYMRYFPAAETIPEDQVVSVNGAGDTFLGVVVAGLAMDGGKGNLSNNLEDLISIAQKASICSLKSKAAVSPEIETLKPLLRSLRASSAST